MLKSKIVFALTLSLLGACATPSTAAPAQAVAPHSARTDALNAACESFRAEQGVVGMRVAVLERGVVAFHAGFGYADREKQLAVGSDTLFRLGSISKPVTAAIAMQLVEEGRLELDRDVRDFAPAARGKLAPITLRQLLSHTSGIRHYDRDHVDNSTKLRTTREALELFVDDPLLFTPGEKYSYSTHAYTLVVHAIESAAKQPFERLVAERIAKKGAASLSCERLRDDKPQRSQLYDKVVGQLALLQLVREDNSWKYGGGGIESTALDLARFGDLMLHDKLVKRSTRDVMWAPTKLADGELSNYGLGWNVRPKRKVVQHGGSQQGCSSALLIDVEGERVIAVLTNTQGGEASKLADALLEQLRAK